MATQAEIDAFLTRFYQSWNSSLQDLQAYNRAIAVAETVTGINYNSVKSYVPTYAQLKGGTNNVTSSGEVSAEAQKARDNNANTSNPTDQVTTPTTVANAVPPAAGVTTDVGTNAPTRELSKTQSIPPITAAPGSIAAGQASAASQLTPTPVGTVPASATSQSSGLPGPGPIPGASVGAQSKSDDASNQATAASQQDQAAAAEPAQRIANKTAVQIETKSNVLDQFASYTYSVSLYIMNPDAYRNMVRSGKRELGGSQLLMQSGGAPVASRNQRFPLDYYIDDIEIKSIMPGKGTSGAHNVTEIKFKITEPNGITLLDNLYAAAQEYVKSNTTTTTNAARTVANYAAQQYLMILRFYGYDAAGNLVVQPSSSLDPAGKTDANAIVEKWIPFLFTNIKFRIANKLTEYDCEAIAVQNMIGTSAPRAVIPYNIQLSATTINQLLSGNQTYTTPSDAQRNTQQPQTGGTQTATGVAQGNANNNNAPAKANAAPSKTLYTGLEQAMNQFEAEQVVANMFNIANRYRFVVSHPEIANSSIVPPGPNNLRQRPSSTPTTGNQVVNGQESVDNSAKNQAIVAGTSVMQFLDLMVSSSDYIFQQQTQVVGPRGELIPQRSPAQAFAWYKIGVQSIPIGYDSKRGDFAYETTFEIAPYAVNNMQSVFFPKGVFRGAHKRYAYWFTGENSAVLNFEQDFNYLYYITVNAQQDQIFQSATSDPREVQRRMYTVATSQPSQGQSGKSLIGKSSAAEFLYSPADQSQTKLTILGDPAWIAQGEVWSGIRSNRTVSGTDSTADPYFSPWLPDGTINFDANEAIFLLSFNKPADYNINTGLMDIKRGQ
jgi:hypothetical protein